jgi:hypothetical protein
MYISHPRDRVEMCVPSADDDMMLMRPRAQQQDLFHELSYVRYYSSIDKESGGKKVHIII